MLEPELPRGLSFTSTEILLDPHLLLTVGPNHCPCRSGQWMRMNDSNVYGVGAPKVLQENAYMLLYVRNGQRPYRTRASKALVAARAAAEEKELAKVRRAAQDEMTSIHHGQ